LDAQRASNRTDGKLLLDVRKIYVMMDKTANHYDIQKAGELELVNMRIW